MLLKRLEISGFKSFARVSTLEFPYAISAIVGPNGSGKSNVADAIRWVLGEQSMKSLRGKKGEDLIFGGTPHVPRMGKASVVLVFDNAHSPFDVPFEEVLISRRVYRDGINEYSINDSQARLKDVIELLSRVGLGASQHHIIGQGDADRILYASPKERKFMIEEALGLKIFEIKKNEASRKLTATEENIRHIESLQRELRPHLKYLEDQAKKSQNTARLQEELHVLVAIFSAREQISIAEDEKRLREEAKPLETKQRELEALLKKSEALLNDENAAQSFLNSLKKLEAKHGAVARQRRERERALGRTEALQEQKITTPSENISREHAHAMLRELRVDLEQASHVGTIELLRNVVFSVTQKVYKFLEELASPEESHQKPTSHDGDLAALRKEITALDTQEAKLIEEKQRVEQEYQGKNQEAQRAGATYRTTSDELNRVRDALRMVAVDTEKLEARKQEFAIEFGALLKGVSGEMNTDVTAFSLEEREPMHKKIERLRIRLEEAGGVDEKVLQEFEQTKARDEFLGRELDDLVKAKNQISGMLGELDIKIAHDFSSGILRINELFGTFFKEIFGGGKAELKLFQPKPKHKSSEEAEEEGAWDEAEEEEPGLDIIVDIPRKRIKSLAMLSGGERALTSIALLFAMATVNPPPFLVLDETDAALDEANSQRYGSMLKALSEKTQLIVITHNRETMKSASILYGVTMGSDGVSKLLSIKLEEAEDVLAKPN